MWCSTCQHDVPATGECDDSLVRCDKCGSALAETSPPRRLAQPRLPDEDWQIEADIRSVHRLIDNLRRTRLDASAEISPPHLPPAAGPAVLIQQPLASGPKSNLAAWTILSLGLAVFACGAVLLGWSIVAEREDLWPIGLPLALAGQAGMIVGLVFQLEGVWQSNRQTAVALSALDANVVRSSRSDMIRTRDLA
jgi:hypothetical protein